MTTYPGFVNPIEQAPTEITINNLATNPVYALAMFLSKNLLISAGWTVGGSGDGTSYSAVVDLLTTAQIIHDNARSWIRLIAPFEDSPGNRQEWTFQLVSSSSIFNHARVKHSRSAGFTGGAPNAITTPSATDEEVLRGGGTDAAPTGGRMYLVTPTATPTVYSPLWGVADRGSNAFYLTLLQTVASRIDGSAWVVDPVRAPVPGLDNFPYVIMAHGSLTAGQFAASNLSAKANSPAFAYIDNSGVIVLQTTVGCRFTSTTATMAPIGTDPNELISEPFDATPILWGQDAATAPAGYIKGWSSLFAWLDRSVASPYQYLYGYESARDLIQINDSVLAAHNGSAVSLPNVGAWTDQGSVFLWDLEGGIAAPTAVMRADDATLAQQVFFPVINPANAAAEYTGPGPLSNIIVYREL